jgi:hypothetical protein
MHLNKICLIWIVFLLFTSCIDFKHKCDIKLPKSAIEDIYLCDSKKFILLDFNQKQDVINKIYSAKCIGPVKGIVKTTLYIKTKNKDTISIKVLDNYIKWQNDGDIAYELNVPETYMANLKNKILKANNLKED